MRVLIVSHNVFSRTSNMGKTLLSYFRDFQPDEIAQFYIHSEIPTDDSICHNYYRFTDKDAIRSLLPFRGCGRVFRKEDIRKERRSARTDSGVTGAVYQLGRKRTALIYALRNLLWKPGRWNTKALRKFVHDFDPDIVFFASGDYAFMYDVARKIADMAGKPLAVCCMDDYYLHNRNENSLLGPSVHRSFMKTVRRTMDRTQTIFTICDSMQREYETLFRKPCHVLHTAANVLELTPDPDAKQISYIGNLDFHRHEQLVRLGRALKALQGGNTPNTIDVYSAEQNPEILKVLTEENGIRFHGAIPADEVLNVMGRSMAVIHTESFEEEMQKQVRFSVSTKIAESLMYGPCLLAFGPKGIASMDYLIENNAAFAITSAEALEAGLMQFLTDGALRQRILQNARALARKNHRTDINSAKVRRWLSDAAHVPEDT